jgi:uncharacterized protein
VRTTAADASADVRVIDDPAKHRHEVFVDGTLAGFALYRLRPGRIVFVHTEAPEHRGR